jgi:hypothetical protein
MARLPDPGPAPTASWTDARGEAPGYAPPLVMRAALHDRLGARGVGPKRSTSGSPSERRIPHHRFPTMGEADAARSPAWLATRPPEVMARSVRSRASGAAVIERIGAAYRFDPRLRSTCLAQGAVGQANE